jgi:DNA-binding transcriptional LysR family regulator
LPMELHQLAYFEAVARQQHFTRAARELNVAQPSVSQQIRKLEAELGAPLFQRTRRGAELTEAGRLFLPRARAVLQQLAEGRAEVQELSALRRGTLRLGAPPSVGTHVFPAVLGAFRARYPGIALVFRQEGSLSLVRRLVEGELDVAVVIQPVHHPALTTEPLLEERLLLALPAGHRLAGGAAVDPAALRDEPFVMLREGVYDLRDQTLAACHRAGFEPRVSLDGGEMDSVLRFVASGLGVAILPQTVLEGRGADAPVGVPLADPLLRRTLALARRTDRAYPAAARAFAGLLRREVGAAG